MNTKQKIINLGNRQDINIQQLAQITDLMRLLSVQELVELSQLQIKYVPEIAKNQLFFKN